MLETNLGEYVNGISRGGDEFIPIYGILVGLFCDPFGRQFARIQDNKGKAHDVDLFVVNASSEDRQRYMDAIERVKELEKAGNDELAEVQQAIIESSNSQINDIYGSLTPLVDLSFSDVDEGDGLPEVTGD